MWGLGQFAAEISNFIFSKITNKDCMKFSGVLFSNQYIAYLIMISCKNIWCHKKVALSESFSSLKCNVKTNIP